MCSDLLWAISQPHHSAEIGDSTWYDTLVDGLSDGRGGERVKDWTVSVIHGHVHPPLER